MISKTRRKKASQALKMKQLKAAANQQKLKLIGAELKQKLPQDINVWLNEYCAQMFFVS